MFRRIIEFVKKEFIEITRDRKTLLALIGFPTVLLVVFTYAGKTDIENLPTAVLDLDGSVESQKLLDSFFHTKYYKLGRKCLSLDELQKSIDKGECFMGIVVPAGFGEKLKNGGAQKPNIQLIIDGSIPPTAEQAATYGQLIAVEFFGGYALGDESKNITVEFSPLRLDTRVMYNPELNAIFFMIPGLIGYLLTFLTVMLSSMSVIRERESGTFEQLEVTPLNGFEIIVGKLVPFGIISFGAVMLILVVSVFWFKLEIRGSLLLFNAGLLLFITASLVFGFFISTVSKNQQQAGQMTIFYMLPSLILSGMYFPVFAMPKFFQIVSYFVPLKYFLTIMRGITLKGVGLESLWPDFIGILAFLLVSTALTVKALGRKGAKG